MNILLSLLKQVAAAPDSVTVEQSSTFSGFPGLVELNFDLKLANGFTVGDWMEDDAVSVAEELQQLDIGAPTSPSKRVAAVWRIAMVDGPVVLMNVEISGLEDDNFNELHLVGYATIIEELEAAPFVAEVMKQQALTDAFKKVETILKEAAKLRKQFEKAFPDGLQRTEALQRLALA